MCVRQCVEVHCLLMAPLLSAQVVVALYSPLIGKTPKECRFRSKYDAAIVAVQRRVRCV